MSRGLLYLAGLCLVFFLFSPVLATCDPGCDGLCDGINDYGIDLDCNRAGQAHQICCCNNRGEHGETCSSCPEDVGKCDGEICSEDSECSSGFCFQGGCMWVNDASLSEGNTCDGGFLSKKYLSTYFKIDDVGSIFQEDGQSATFEPGGSLIVRLNSEALQDGNWAYEFVGEVPEGAIGVFSIHFSTDKQKWLRPTQLYKTKTSECEDGSTMPPYKWVRFRLEPMSNATATVDYFDILGGAGCDVSLLAKEGFYCEEGCINDSHCPGGEWCDEASCIECSTTCDGTCESVNCAGEDPDCGFPGNEIACCGNGNCDGEEDCNTCVIDCGDCPVKQLNLTVTFKPCSTNTITECQKNNAVNRDVIYINKTEALLVEYAVNFEGEPVESLIEVLEDKNPICVFENNTCNETASAGAFLLKMDPGSHKIELSANNSEFPKESISQKILVGQIDLESKIRITLPKKASTHPEEDINLNMNLENLASSWYHLRMYHTMDAEVQENVALKPGGSETVPIEIHAPEETGKYEFLINISAISSTINPRVLGSVSRKVDIVVTEGEFFGVDVIELRLEGRTLVALVVSSSESLKNYSIETCLGPTYLELSNSGLQGKASIGEIDSSCEICVISEDGSQCLTAEPVWIEFGLPDSVQAMVGEESKIKFLTTSNFDTVIEVTPNPWMQKFTCASTCNKNLKFTPDETGKTKLTFDIKLPEYDIKTSAMVLVDVSEAEASNVDLTLIQKNLEELETELESFEKVSIYIPAARRILENVKKASPESPEDVARLLGELDEARFYIEFTKKTKMPEERIFPIQTLLVGIVAIVVGIGIILFAFFRTPPKKPTNRTRYDTFH